ncbi:MAG: N-acetyl-gamma-glutamyl-phosphate reductase [Candidatus Lokiarchaeum sp. GC14_75]|nr:MAG: N-acetyl-gamma-glutamyl-phosphate reductase [Candidatus Lokiarchaeum sp. GC14_75]
MIKVGIIGATGYSGSELVRILYHHPKVDIITLSSNSHNDQVYSSVFENFNKISEMKCEEEDLESLSEELDVVFLALPNGKAFELLTDSILKNVKVIDLSGDFRLKDVGVYEEWYKLKHLNESLIDKATYGLSEWKRSQIKNSSLISNPGCYPTCALLSLLPLIKENILEENSIIIDAKSGVSGAGRSLNLTTHFSECNESIKPYSVKSHRHTPEIEQELNEITGNGNSIIFTPHLLPMNRGILCTIYGTLKQQINYDEIKNIYEKYYKDEYFIRLTKENIFPETKWVKGSNYCDIGFTSDKRSNKIIIIGAIDNLIKGAAGQAVQNMNIMFNLKENMGLDSIPIFPI